jgi:hypothetical protein
VYAYLDYSVARCIRRTPSDAEKNLWKETARCDPGAHTRGAEAVRCVDYTGGRLAISVHAFGRCSSQARFSSESTTIGLLAKLSGLIEPLREFIKTKSVWGTCAGAILLSQAVSNPKKGGQELLGSVSVKMTRNGWGSQVRRLPFGF